jgi:signal transduction histidine kinase
MRRCELPLIGFLIWSRSDSVHLRFFNPYFIIGSQPKPFMKFVISFNFIVLALIMVGLYFVSNANYRALNQSAKYWSWAVILDALGLTLLACLFITFNDLSEHTILGTLSNTALFSSLVYQALSIKAIRIEISPQKHRMVLALILTFAVAWDYLRIHADVNQKIILFASVALAILMWQIYEIKKDIQGKQSRQLNIIFYSLVGEASFTCVRIVSVSGLNAEIVSSEQLPLLGVFAVWLQYALKIITYAALVEYWSESLAKKKLAAELEAQEFKALSERQEKLIAELGRLNKAATAGVLAASISHELSQPLQSILLNNSVAVDEASSPTPDIHFLKSTLQEQVENINRMIEIINTLRGVFTESGAKEQRIDMFELTERLGLLITPQAQKRGIQIELEKNTTAVVHVKISEVQQVLLNLVGNAFDALIGSQIAQPRIKITFSTDSGWVTCSVEDNGPGIAPAKQADIFKFLTTSKDSGMGLGLWLSKYIIERNKGHISVSTSTMGGAKFTIQLPQAT